VVQLRLGSSSSLFEDLGLINLTYLLLLLEVSRISLRELELLEVIRFQALVRRLHIPNLLIGRLRLPRRSGVSRQGILLHLIL